MTLEDATEQQLPPPEFPTISEPPARLCCGERHYGAQCPDGLVMCCLCFDRFPVGELNVGEDGRPENVCKGCTAIEQQVLQDLKPGHD